MSRSKYARKLSGVFPLVVLALFAFTGYTLLNIGSADQLRSPAVSVSSSTPLERSDINGNGSVDIFDLSVLLSDWGSTAAPDSDINQNGSVDIFDLSTLLSFWGDTVTYSGTSYYVSLSGTSSNDCSELSPCDALETVLFKYGNAGTNVLGASTGDEIIFEDGVYDGKGKGSTGTIFVQNQVFDNIVTVRPRTTYKARLTNNEKVLFIEGVRNMTFTGFEMTHKQPYASSCSSGNNTAYVILLRDVTGGHFGSTHGPDNGHYNASRQFVPGGDDYTGNISFTDNIIHGSQCNDLLKMQNVGDITVSGNMFYDMPHAGSVSGASADEGIDANSVFNVDITDNVFFNDSVSGVLTGPFIVVKDSDLGVPHGNRRFGLVDGSGSVIPGTEHPGGALDNNTTGGQGGRDDTCDPNGTRCDNIIGSQNVSIARNIFYGFVSTETDKPFIQLGAEDTRNYNSMFTSVTDNVFLFNTPDTSRGPVDLEGTYGVTYANNTVTGNGPAKSFGFRAKDQTDGYVNQYPNHSITVQNNLYNNTAGTMLGWSSVSSAADAVSSVVTNNLFYNGGSTVPDNSGHILQPSDDSSAVFANPQLASPSGLLPADWGGASFSPVVSGGTSHGSIRDVFLDIADRYCTLPSGSPALGAGNPVATEGTLYGAARSSSDIGACPAR